MNLSNNKVFIDASLFMGMHSENETVRQRSVGFMASRFKDQVFMNLEQVGLCDEHVWQYERQIQDAYYPFMDVLHSEMDVQRVGYCEADIARINEDDRFASAHLSVQQKLLIAQVINQNGVLFTHDQALHAQNSFQEYLGQFEEHLTPSITITKAEKIPTPEMPQEPVFSTILDALYETSKVLVVPFKSSASGSEQYV